MLRLFAAEIQAREFLPRLDVQAAVVEQRGGPDLAGVELLVLGDQLDALGRRVNEAELSAR